MTIKFKGDVWLYKSGEGAWRFVTLPKDHSEIIKEIAVPTVKKGFGSVKVSAKIGKSEWKTSIFPDNNRGAYILPIKQAIRKKENIESEDSVEVEISLIDF